MEQEKKNPRPAMTCQAGEWICSIPSTGAGGADLRAG